MDSVSVVTVGISLEECLLQVKKVLRDNFNEALWVRAEISQIQERRGHYYLQLVDSQKENEQPAKCSASIWSSQVSSVITPFEQITGQPLTSGMNILMLARPTFHEKFGFSLSILQIDPTYSMGDIARRRQEVIDRLRDGDLLDRNRQVEAPLVFHRIAVFSSDQAAGYQDFMRHLQERMGSIWYRTELFPVALQGADVRPTFEAAFRSLQHRFTEFDCLVIVRGGGAVSDLSGFDDELLARMVACCRIPVISGIGHERDNTVLDMVAAQRAITPTDAADIIIRRADDFHNALLSVSERLEKISCARMDHEHDLLLTSARRIERSARALLVHKSHQLASNAAELRRSSESRVRDQYYHLRTYSSSIASLSVSVIKQQKQQLAQWDTTLKVADPVNILKRGFSITYANGAVVKHADHVAAGTQLRTVLANGELCSVTEQEKDRE